jgi:DNA gyrase inhibitor GyrI
MPLTLEPDLITWPETHYVFIEKTGPFQINAPLAWQELHQRLPELAALYPITSYFSLYRMDAQIYRAGVALPARPDDVPLGLHYEHFHGGKYTRFTLTGSYSQLPEVTGQLFHTIAEKKIPLRDDFNIEHYVNNPRDTPEDRLITEILFPIA